MLFVVESELLMKHNVFAAYVSFGVIGFSDSVFVDGPQFTYSTPLFKPL